MNSLAQQYAALLKKHGHQGWWPIDGVYHPGDYSAPRTPTEQWEVCMGALLTQNTRWENAERALTRLRKARVREPEDVLRLPLSKLQDLVQPSGFFRQKAERLRTLATVAQQYEGINRLLLQERNILLGIKGVGPETADTMLLYAGKRPFFVVDAYTRRVSGLTGTYEDIRARCERELPQDWKIYQEFHALLVIEGKALKSLNVTISK